MIDYEKLAEAYELAEKYYNSTGISILIEVHIAIGCRENDPELWIDKKYIPVNSIDEIITKLQELTKPEPKYEVGQETWMIIGDYPEIVKIDGIVQYENYWHYRTEYGSLTEDELYPTKQSLIQAQIDYWQNLKHSQFANKEYQELNDINSNQDGLDVNGCQHECDGIDRNIESDRKCKKCGEFYR